MRLIFLGPPGVGKGTQAARFSERHDIVHIATGDLLRTAISEKTEVGLKAKDFIEAGHLVPDEVIIQLMKDRLQASDVQSGYVLDGFPRTLAQGKALSDLLKQNGSSIDRVICFYLDEAILLERIVGRRTCPSCHSVYHLRYRKPETDGFCRCGTALIKRTDDTAETVTERVAVYNNETATLIAYYKGQGLLTEVNADRALDAVSEAVEQVFQESSI